MRGYGGGGASDFSQSQANTHTERLQPAQNLVLRQDTPLCYGSGYVQEQGEMDTHIIAMKSGIHFEESNKTISCTHHQSQGHSHSNGSGRTRVETIWI